MTRIKIRGHQKKLLSPPELVFLTDMRLDNASAINEANTGHFEWPHIIEFAVGGMSEERCLVVDGKENF